MDRRVRFVTVAGPSIGRGHLARAVSLTEATWPAGTDLQLEVDGSTELTERERRRIDATGTAVVEPGSDPGDGTVVVIDVPDPDAVVARFEAPLTAVFDDRESFRGNAALVIQPSLPTWSGRARADRVLAGFDVVPVAAAIRRRRAGGLAAVDVAGRHPKVLVCFGGSDPDRVTERVVPPVASALHGKADLDVVIGASYSGSTGGWPVTPTRDPDDLVERLARADLVVGGAGTMKFELACLGRPMLLLAVADDQRPVGPAFAATGAARYLGDGRTLDPAVVATAVVALLTDDSARERLSMAASSVVDGAGADRIADAVAAIPQAAGSS